jgi:hypothetical protein
MDLIACVLHVRHRFGNPETGDSSHEFPYLGVLCLTGWWSNVLVGFAGVPSARNTPVTAPAAGGKFLILFFCSALVGLGVGLMQLQTGRLCQKSQACRNQSSWRRAAPARQTKSLGEIIARRHQSGGRYMLLGRLEPENQV